MINYSKARFILERYGMADNRYDARERLRKERRKQWLLDEELRQNAEIDARDRRALEKQRQRDELLTA